MIGIFLEGRQQGGKAQSVRPGHPVRFDHDQIERVRRNGTSGPLKSCRNRKKVRPGVVLEAGPRQ